MASSLSYSHGITYLMPFESGRLEATVSYMYLRLPTATSPYSTVALPLHRTVPYI